MTIANEPEFEPSDLQTDQKRTLTSLAIDTQMPDQIPWLH
jgi:hypothetical protein